MRLIRLDKKIRAGAHFIQTQPVFDPERFALWMEKVRAAGLHEKAAILAGVMPVKSAKALEYMKEEVPGVRIHPEYIDRMSRATDPAEEGVRIAVETIRFIRQIPGIRGIHLMPVLWESITPVVLREAGLYETSKEKAHG
jgi:methylenetetrahydrofolate reductase (NADPH)